MSLASVWTDPLLSRIVGAYDSPVVRAYCRVRFLILRKAILDDIGAHLPRSGTVLDIGCGFGLFSLYFASSIPGIEIRGSDLSARRVEAARRAAHALGLTNVRFEVADAAAFQYDRPVNAAYMLDLIHHIPPSSVSLLLSTVTRNLGAGGCLIIKDIERTPAYKLAFTWLLDKLVDYRAPVHYWPPEDVEAVLASLGLGIRRQRLPDYLPYPHILYVATKPDRRR